uniref:Hypotheticial protein n=1 Tax=Schistosoma japonicum TaxID=6182 RepID=C1L597_SCHJA|nr:hypotheticial protein [Schistosoma japonicum]
MKCVLFLLCLFVISANIMINVESGGAPAELTLMYDRGHDREDNKRKKLILGLVGNATGGNLK